MKIWTSEHIFNHPWEKVVEAAWRKYPNPMNPAVIGIDVVDRKVSEGVLLTKRLITSKWGLPSWAQTILGGTNIFYAKECSSVDPKARIMEMKTHNLTAGSIIAIDETLSYEPHPEDPGKTKLKQEAVVTVKGIPLSSYFEGLVTTNISHNANKGRQAIEWVIEKIETEVEDLKTTAIKSIDEITLNAKKSMDDLSSAAKKSFEDFQIGSTPSSKKCP
ncbi:unnamed protein product [Bemisia tabaci]|uniref:PRELI/MSF1 domain-containing protein n=2 Tax=Bemisia tabaci TaxID=7038 RepID=A0A9P0F9K5_BEMTA|nr:unnamed protein product [Bemisia tabaci]